MTYTNHDATVFVGNQLADALKKTKPPMPTYGFGDAVAAHDIALEQWQDDVGAVTDVLKSLDEHFDTMEFIERVGLD